MKIEMKLTFKSMEELEQWFNSCCTRCAFCNCDNGKNDPCECCRADKVYRAWEEFFKNGGKK